MANDRRLVTVDYLEEYAASLDIAPVDQAFDGDSENAQSGVAVAQAVEQATTIVY